MKNSISMNKYLLSILFCLLTTVLLGQKKDVEGSKDYDLFNRMPDYFIKKYWEYDFDSHEIKKSEKEVFVVEGKKTVINYEHQHANNKEIEKPSYLQILRNYSNAITNAGGQILFEHRKNEYGFYYLKTRQGKQIWAEIKPAPNVGRRYLITVVENEPMNQDISVSADIIKEEIELHGKIAIYGIYFDVGKATLKTESKPAFEQIAKYLVENPKVNCWVVGHTDADGSFETNSNLSLERAKAVKSFLTSNYGISSERLFSEGVGPLAPVASNSTEEGKQLNRRVELVKK